MGPGTDRRGGMKQSFNHFKMNQVQAPFNPVYHHHSHKVGSAGREGRIGELLLSIRSFPFFFFFFFFFADVGVGM